MVWQTTVKVNELGVIDHSGMFILNSIVLSSVSYSFHFFLKRKETSHLSCKYPPRTHSCEWFAFKCLLHCFHEEACAYAKKVTLLSPENIGKQELELEFDPQWFKKKKSCRETRGGRGKQWNNHLWKSRCCCFQTWSFDPISVGYACSSLRPPVASCLISRW